MTRLEINEPNFSASFKSFKCFEKSIITYTQEYNFDILKHTNQLIYYILDHAKDNQSKIYAYQIKSYFFTDSSIMHDPAVDFLPTGIKIEIIWYEYQEVMQIDEGKSQ